MRKLIILIIKLILLICNVAEFFPERLCFDVNIFLLIFEIFEICIAWAETFLELKEIFIFLFALKCLILQSTCSFLVFCWALVKLTFLILLLHLALHILVLLKLISWTFMQFKIILTLFILRTDFIFCCFHFLPRFFINILVKKIVINIYNLLYFTIFKLFIFLFDLNILLIFSVINEIFLMFFFFFAFCLFFLSLLFLLSFHKNLNRQILF